MSFQRLSRRGFIAAAALGSARPASAEPASLRIAWLKAPNDLTLARARGSLERSMAEAGVHVAWAGPYAAAAPAIEALAAGAVDMTVGSSTAFVTARAAGVPLVLFAAQRISPAGEAILVREASPIQRLADLVGRTVAVNRGGTGEYLLVRALRRAGISLDQVRRAYLAPGDASAAFASGAVDAWATWDPFISIACASGARVLADGAACGSENAVAYFVARDFLAERRLVVSAVLDVLSRENAWAGAHRDEAGAIWAREMGLPEGLGPRLGAANTPPLGPVGSDAARQIEGIADWYVENRIVSTRPDIAGFLVDLAKTG